MTTTPLPPAAVTLTVAAGVLHLAAARGHLGVSSLLVAAFVAVGLVQIATVATARRWPAATLEAIVAVDLAAVGAWAVSRTVGLPLVGAEAVGAADLVVVALQLLAVVAVMLPWLTAARAGLASATVVASLVAVAVAAPGMGHAHAPSDGTGAGPSGSLAPVAVVQLGPGDFEGDTDLTDPVGATAMKELMTGAVSPIVVTSAGRVLGTPAEHAPGDDLVVGPVRHDPAADGPVGGHDDEHTGDGHADDGHTHG